MIRGGRGRALIVVAVLMAAAAAAAQSYGDHDQVLRIPAADFQGEDYVEAWIGPDGYAYGGDGVDTRVATGLLLPDGAVVTRLCFATLARPAITSLADRAVQTVGVVHSFPGEVATADDSAKAA